MMDNVDRIAVTPEPDRGRFEDLVVGETIGRLRMDEVGRWRAAKPEVFEG